MKHPGKRSDTARFHWIALLLALLLLAYPACASPKDDLEQTKAELADSQARQEQLAEEQKKLEAELATLQQALVKSAAATQRSEAEMATVRDKLRILNDQKRLKSTDLERRRKTLTAMAQAALSLSRMPPEAMVMLPGGEGGSEAIKAAAALKMTSDSIREEMKSVEIQAGELERLKKKADASQAELARKREDLAKEQAKLQERVVQREKLREKLGRRRAEEEKRAAELAKKAESLQALVSSVGEGSKRVVLGRKARSMAAAKGRLAMPVSGRLVQGYGPSRKGEAGKGVVIAADADGAQVVAPFDGEVVFAGPFLNYGNLVILRHSDDFHTLLAGLGMIKAEAGDFLLEGEPIGAMGNGEAGQRLYVEIRKDNQPVNPEPWIKNLTKPH